MNRDSRKSNSSGSKIAVDFGTSNTTVAIWDDSQQDIRLIRFPNVSVRYNYRNILGTGHADLVPSVIKFEGKGFLIGKEALDGSDIRLESQFRNMKRFISANRPLPRRVFGRKIDFFEAGSAFLGEILDRAFEITGFSDPELIFSVPAESFENYRAWIGDLTGKMGIGSWRVIDEATACALGYGGEAGDLTMIFDFGGGTLELALVRLEDCSAKNGKGSSVIAKCGCELGGMDIDAWIMNEFLRVNSVHLAEIGDLSCLLRNEAERVKVDLSFNESSVLRLDDSVEKRTYELPVSRPEFREILDAQGFFDSIRLQINKLLDKAMESGINQEEIDKVCVVGGSGLIPSVQDLLFEKFGEKVVCFSPFDAVSRGAALALSGTEMDDHIQHEYAMRHWDDARDERRLAVFVSSGTRYPSEHVAAFSAAASHLGQTDIELAIYEVGGDSRIRNDFEIVYEPDGRISLEPPKRISEELPLNAGNPTFIVLEPPASEVGKQRVDLTFDIDGRKMLLVTAKDTLTGKHICIKKPVIRLK